MAGRKLTILPSLGEFPQQDDLLYVVDVSDTSESPQGTSKSVEFGEILKTGRLTISPVITDGSGSSDDFTVDYFIIGGKVFLNGFTRSFVIADGDATLEATLDLTGTAVEPSDNFSGSFGVVGGATTQNLNGSAGADVVEAVSLATLDSTKKLQVVIGLTAAMSGSDYDTTFSFYCSFDI
jgi:hypothetical protein